MFEDRRKAKKMYSLYPNTNLITVDLKNYVRLAVLVHNCKIWASSSFRKLCCFPTPLTPLWPWTKGHHRINATLPQYHVIVEGYRERGRSSRVEGPLAWKVLCERAKVLKKCKASLPFIYIPLKWDPGKISTKIGPHRSNFWKVQFLTWWHSQLVEGLG